jgi:hypothetical protein
MFARLLMFFQRVLKGIPAATGNDPGLTEDMVRRIVAGEGIICNWWHNKPDGAITLPEIQAKLTETALYDHLVNYDTVKSETPFISTTAGTVASEVELERYTLFPAIYTAVRFATRNFSQDGYVVHAYVYTLGKRAIELEEFAEEVRDVNTYTSYYAWHPEGEIVAKIHIPARRIEKIEQYRHTGLAEQLDQGIIPTPAPGDVFADPSVYRDPLQYANVRGYLGFS